MMTKIAIHQRVIAGDDCKIHLSLPPEMGKHVEVIILPVEEEGLGADLDDMGKQMENAFLMNILSDPEEDVWNDL